MELAVNHHPKANNKESCDGINSFKHHIAYKAHSKPVP